MDKLQTAIQRISEMSREIEKIIVDALGTNGLQLGNVEILTVSSNIMGFIKDLANQLDEAYVNNPDKLMSLVEGILDEVFNYKISDMPATMLTDIFGTKVGEHCNIAEFTATVLYCYYGGDEDVSDYPYVEDVLNRFYSGELAQEIFNLLRKIVVTDLVQGEILSTLKFNPGELFPNGNIFYVFGRILQGITEVLLGGDNSFLNLVESVLSIPLVPEDYSSIDSIINTLLGEYITFSQYQAWGGTIAWMLSSLCIDNNPGLAMDSNVNLPYDGKVEVAATEDNYRLPSHIVTTLSEDSSTEANITWLTKYSLTDTDIQLVPYGEAAGGDYRIRFGGVEEGRQCFYLAGFGSHPFYLQVPGRHLVLNAAAAIALGVELLREALEQLLRRYDA